MLRDRDDGASAVEYGILIAAVASMIILLVYTIGAITRANFGETCAGIKSGASSSVQAASNCP